MFIINQKSDAYALDRLRPSDFTRSELACLGSAIPQRTASDGRELHIAANGAETHTMANGAETHHAMTMKGSNTGITGVAAHAAVRTHAPVVTTDAFWSYCQETKFGANPKNSHFQRWKVAN